MPSFTTGGPARQAFGGQINVIVHAVGILVALPEILELESSCRVCRSAPGIRVARTISRPIGASTSSELGAMGLL